MLRVVHWTIGFTYFMQLSNLGFAPLAVAIQLACQRRGGKTGSAAVVKYTATVSILATFVVYLLVLAPMTPGCHTAYRQDDYVSLGLHLVTPLLMLADYLQNDAGYPWKPGRVLYAALPPVGYFLFILPLGAGGVCWNGIVVAVSIS